MKTILFTVIFLLSATTITFAQKSFLIKNGSKIFDVKMQVESCDSENICNSPATVYLSKKNQKQVFQTINMSETYFQLDEKQQLTGNLTLIPYKKFYGFYFKDFNFDGVEDLAISNGNYAPYGGITYDIFLFSKASGKFVKNEQLTELENQNMSFEVNKKRKTIETSTKSGCCWHGMSRYKYINNRLVEVYSYTEDAQGDGENMQPITQRRIGGKLRTTVKTVKIKDYYKEP